MQYSTMQYSKMQYSTIQYSTMQYSTMQYSTMQYSTIQYSTMQYSTMQYSTMQYSTIQYSTMQYSTIQYSTIQYSTMQYSTMQYSTMQCNVASCSVCRSCYCWGRDVSYWSRHREDKNMLELGQFPKLDPQTIFQTNQLERINYPGTKSHIRETPNLSTDADRSTIFFFFFFESIWNDSLFLRLYDLVHKFTSPLVEHLPRLDLPRVQSGTTPCF